jgi:hypothetical protein
VKASGIVPQVEEAEERRVMGELDRRLAGTDFEF